MISADGRLVTTARTLEGAAKAVAELPSGAIKNVVGVLASSAEADLAIVKTDVTGAPFLPVDTSPQIAVGQQVAIVESGTRRRDEPATAGKIASVRSEPAGDALQITGENLRGSAGSPVVDEHGAVVAFITADEHGTTLNSARSAAALRPLIAQIQPNAAPTWSAGSPSPTPSSTPSGTPKPRQSPTAAGDATLVYTPYPRYPASARFSSSGTQSGSGQYLVKFGSDGAAQSVQVIRSTGNQLLDQAAVDALKSWRAQRGRPSQKIVPITLRRP